MVECTSRTAGLGRKSEGAEEGIVITSYSIHYTKLYEEVTPWVLGFLKAEGLKACFFCVGENVQRNPELFEKVQAEGSYNFV